MIIIQVEYSGGTCDHPNLKYYISFSTVYYMICVVSFIQLMLCINSEIARQKPRSISRAFRVNIQKSLYFFICIATAIRGFYFSSPSNGQLAWTESLMSAYYPILMSGSSLLVCFWAEVCMIIIICLILILIRIDFSIIRFFIWMPVLNDLIFWINPFSDSSYSTALVILFI